VPYRVRFVQSNVVEHDDVVALEVRNEELFDVGPETLAVNRALELAGASIRSLSRAAGKVAVLQSLWGTLATGRRPRSPAGEAGHIGLAPGLVDEDEALGIDALLMVPPSPSMAHYVRTDPARTRPASPLSVTRRRRTKQLISEVSAANPRSAATGRTAPES